MTTTPDRSVWNEGIGKNRRHDEDDDSDNKYSKNNNNNNKTSKTLWDVITLANSLIFSSVH